METAISESTTKSQELADKAFDKETLIHAALAAGFINPGDQQPYDTVVCMHNGLMFNSFHSNHDCFSLETALELDVVFLSNCVEVFVRPRIESDSVKEYYADHNGDRERARRFASTRAAALRL
jgi:hypothetical protein